MRLAIPSLSLRAKSEVMEKQFNSDMEPVNEIETLTYMVGQSQLPETPFLDLIYKEDGAKLYLLHDGREFILNADVEGEVTHNRLKHFDRIFLAVILGLIEREIDYVKAYVKTEDLNFAKYFGFEDLNTLRVLINTDGTRVFLNEMIYRFPELDNA